MAPPNAGRTAALSPDTQRILNKKFRKRKHEEQLDMPELLRDSDESSAEEDQQNQGPQMFVNMNQSIFGLIAAAGSRVDFNDRFDESSSSSGEDNDEDTDEAAHDGLIHSTILKPLGKDKDKGLDKKTSRRKKLSGAKLLQSLPALPTRLKASRSKREPSRLSAPVESTDEANELTPPAIKLTRAKTDRDLPVMSRMLEARAEMSSRPSFDLDVASEGSGRTSMGDGTTPLSRRLMEIFEFNEPEQVIEEYPCWLLQNVLLQGFLYVTAKHICFYAYLPKKANEVAKSGFLSKSGKRNPKYNRYWFRLKGDVLSYYVNPTNLYFPHGQIDLSYGISASVTDKEKEGVNFQLVTRHRTYNFRADSAPSAKEWVKSLQRVIFRSHNDGDSVKISLPIDNIIDVEDTQMMEFADTCKIRVIDNDETYAIDEYFFSFFSFGKEAIDILKSIVESNNAAIQRKERTLAEQLEGLDDQSSVGSAASDGRVSIDKNRPLAEQVKATLSPMSPQSHGSISPRASSDNRRPSFEAFRQMGRKSLDLSGAMRDESPKRSFSGSRRSLSRRRIEDNKTPQQHTSTDSIEQSSVEDPSYSNIAASSLEDASASQILKDSEVFHQSPAMLHPVSASQSGELKSKATTSREQLPPLNIPPKDQDERHSRRREPASADNAGPYMRPTTPTLQNISKMGAYPLQRAGAFAEYLNKTRQRMSTLLASESMGYVEKVSGMWKGGRKHYDEPAGLRIDDDDLEEDSEGKLQTSMERFRAHFALPESEKLQATFFGYILRVLPLYGKIYISDRSFCFRSLLPGTRTKLILPLKDMETVQKEKGFRFGYSGLVVVIRGHEELFFEFGHAESRDDCAVTLLRSLEATRYLRDAGLLNTSEDDQEDSATAERDALQSARQDEFPDHELRMPRQVRSLSNAPTILLDESDASLLNFKPRVPMRITCLTIGSRGDVQPYIALCKGLLADGHHVRIATHAEFQGWIESYGIEFARVEGDPGELMRLCIENGTFTWSFLREANSTFRGWLDDVLDSAYKACEGSELLIESPSAMAGIHIAEKLGIPYFRAFTMPWTRTRAYPHAFIMPEHKMGGAYNWMTYIMFDNIFWKATAHQINRWRNHTLGLPSTSLDRMQPNKVPFLYNFSPSVVVPPLDFSDWIRVTGYWFLDEADNYEPPKELSDFIQKARDDGKKIVYVGFGSIIVNDPAKMTQEVIDAVLKSDVRCILSKGWSERVTAKSEEQPQATVKEPDMPPEIHVIKSAPHDWLFRQVDAAAHHGGSGTTGASLRAGIPTIIRPFFGDQYFFASRVEDLGVGVWVRKWGTNSFGRALWEATRNDRMIAKARVLGEQIRSEKGVETAIQCIYRDLEYAKGLIKRKAGKNLEGDGNDIGDEEDEESWTFVGGDEPDPDLVTTKLSEGLASGTVGSKALGSKAIKGSA